MDVNGPLPSSSRSLSLSLCCVLCNNWNYFLLEFSNFINFRFVSVFFLSSLSPHFISIMTDAMRNGVWVLIILYNFILNLILRLDSFARNHHLCINVYRRILQRCRCSILLLTMFRPHFPFHPTI